MSLLLRNAGTTSVKGLSKNASGERPKSRTQYTRHYKGFLSSA